MVDSVLKQEQKHFILELLVIDGGSTDGTKEKIIKLQKEHPSIRFINNEKKIAPAAFNKGIKSASGEYIAILGAHSQYDANYLDICLQELQRHNCIACSGKVEVAKNSTSWQSILIYCILTSNFGVSSSSYRTIKEGIGEQCPYPVFKRSVFDEVGFYNEILIRNQDNDMNYRIRQRGHHLYYTHKVSAYYYPKQTFEDLLEYAVRTGEWNAISLQISPASLATRHLVPLFFSFTLLSGLILIGVLLFFSTHLANLIFSILFVIVGTHLMIGTVISVAYTIKTKLPLALLLPFFFFSFHFCYGWGTIVGLFKGKR
jgi:glycosyltransferase involved in cell wall biosynthesis